MIGLDSCAIIEILNNQVHTIQDEEFAIANLVFYEVYAFANPAEKQILRHMWDHCKQVYFDEEATFLACELQERARKKGKEVPSVDCLIIASYLQAGVQKILTQNKKQFDDHMIVVEY
jgi:predicted nucleic acid-binding protein